MTKKEIHDIIYPLGLFCMFVGGMIFGTGDYLIGGLVLGAGLVCFGISIFIDPKREPKWTGKCERCDKILIRDYQKWLEVKDTLGENDWDFPRLEGQKWYCETCFQERFKEIVKDGSNES